MYHVSGIELRRRVVAKYGTTGGIVVDRRSVEVDAEASLAELTAALDDRVGVLLASTYEYSGRYSRWDIGFCDPPIQVVSKGDEFVVESLTDRGVGLLSEIREAIGRTSGLVIEGRSDTQVRGTVRRRRRLLAEEERTRLDSVFSLVRCIRELLHNHEEAFLGLYGAFGYDLVYQFERIRMSQHRPDWQRDMVLFLPDEILVIDHSRATATQHSYEFGRSGEWTTVGISREVVQGPFTPCDKLRVPTRDHERGEYAKLVGQAKEYFKRGDLFEVVPGQAFRRRCTRKPSELFARLRRDNPAPYSFLMNLGSNEFLVGASPEMFVKTEGKRVETCPISGTIRRGRDSLEDADQVMTLLTSEKDRAELTMCTDVDRNDKSRVCAPGSVRVIGRRLVEMYATVIHTVDHVEGTLREEMDGLDAFATHAWAVTVTGAPKLWAMRFIEAHERSCRRWYGGAVGLIGVDGNVNTGLTLRTIQIKDGIAEVRAGGTLLIDSDPDEEERETELKASIFLEILEDRGARANPADVVDRRWDKKSVLLLDHEDSFVHTLAGYFRETGAGVTTWRVEPVDSRGDAEVGDADIRGIVADEHPDLVVLSPGPGSPSDFGMDQTIGTLVRSGVAVFGVCLGLQGIVEFFGGRLSLLPSPMHGKESTVETVVAGGLFDGVPRSFRAGRYHSLYVRLADVPDELEATAVADGDVVMAVRHRCLPLAAVQFHPESIMTAKGSVGGRIVANVMKTMVGDDEAR